MESIEDMQRLRKLAFDHLQVGFPEVRADRHNLLASFFAELVKKTKQGFNATLFADKQQTAAKFIDLIDKS